jgi:hypothetical protein
MYRQAISKKETYFSLLYANDKKHLQFPLSASREGD